MLCTINLRCVPPTRAVHHSAQGRPTDTLMAHNVALNRQGGPYRDPGHSLGAEVMMVHNAAQSVYLSVTGPKVRRK